MSTKDYWSLSLGNIEVGFEDEIRATWRFSNEVISGVAARYCACDRNFGQRRDWRFEVRIPSVLADPSVALQANRSYIEVRPLEVPNLKCWAGLDRKPLLFGPCTAARFRGLVYAKLWAIDPSTRKKTLLKWEGARLLKKHHGLRICRKSEVSPNAGRDADQPVAVVDLADHAGMIRLWIVLKAWCTRSDCLPGNDRFPGGRPPVRKTSPKRQNRKRRKGRKQPAGLSVCVTGRLAYGRRSEVSDWLSAHGCRVDLKRVGPWTDVLLVGPHHRGRERLKIRDAKAYGVPRLSEEEFRRAYGI